MIREDFELWTSLPQTTERLSEVEAEIERLKERLSYGGTISGDSYAATAINTSLVVGQINGLRQLLSVDLEETKED